MQYLTYGDQAVTAQPDLVGPVYLDVGGGYATYDPNQIEDPGFIANPPQDIMEDPRVQQALQQLQQAAYQSNQGPAGLFGIPWSWVAGGLLLVLLLRR